MSDLEPVISELHAVDPYVTRVLTRKLVRSADFRSLGGIGTSCTIITQDDVTNVTRQLEFERETLLDRVRCEIILMADTDAGVRQRPIRDRSTQVIRPRRIEKPQGDRACVLAEAVQRSSNEFIVVCGQGHDPLTGFAEILGHMWTEGADIGVLSREDLVSAEDGTTSDSAAQVPAWLGLSPGTPANAIVMRRWFARWIFNEIDRAINPAEEIADRIRLLGTLIIHANVADWFPRAMDVAG